MSSLRFIAAFGCAGVAAWLMLWPRQPYVWLRRRSAAIGDMWYRPLPGMRWLAPPFDPNERAVRPLRARRHGAVVRMFVSSDPEAHYRRQRRAIASTEARGRFLLAVLVVGAASLIWP